MKNPLVSVCIPTYNGEKYLAQCIDSVLAQTYKNYELIIVDDCSKDKTVAIVESYSDNRIRLYRNENNIGLVNNWNKCLEFASGEWIKFVFQDDLISPDMLAVMMQYARPEIKFIVCNREFLFEKDVSAEIKNLYMLDRKNLANIFSIENPSFVSAYEISQKMVKWRYLNYFGEPTVVAFQKSVISEIGLFNPLLGQICDLEYWFRLGSRYGLFYIPSTLAWFRVHNEAASAKNRKGRQELIDYIVILEQMLFARHFAQFRKHINALQKYFIELFIRRQIYVVKAYLKSTSEPSIQKHFDDILLNYPHLSKFTNSTSSLFILNSLIYMRRLVYKKTGVTIG